MSLERYGWDSYFEQQIAAADTEPGRVRLATARRAQVYTAKGTADISLPRNRSGAVVGDWLLFDPIEGVAVRILGRRNLVARKRPGMAPRRQILAANVEAVLIVLGLDREISLRQIERYLVCVVESGASPVIVLNKADICDCAAERATAIEETYRRFPVVPASAVTGIGLADLGHLLPRHGTAALAGPSGSGKSSLVNALLNADRMRVGTVRSSDRRGRHTTTRREMALHPEGGLLMDLPGIRELHPWSHPETVDAVFEEISRWATDCLYRDCRHAREPGCAINAAVANGTVDPERLASYRELREEQVELARMLEASRQPT